MSFDELKAQVPHIHGDQTYGIHPDLAAFLNDTVGPGQSTLETGAGLSTLTILRKEIASHVAITPSAAEFTVIRAFCSAHGISLDPLRAIDRPSQHYLPSADLPELDLVLIDGDHSFAVPFIDWYYTAERLKVGGLMVVDDIHIATGLILVDFLRADPKWKEVWRPARRRFAVYRKRAHPIHEGAWWEQPYLNRVYPTRTVTLHQRLTFPVLQQAVYARLPSPLKQALRSAKRHWSGVKAG